MKIIEVTGNKKEYIDLLCVLRSDKAMDTTK